MKHGQNNNNRRQRSRGNPRRYPNQKGGSFESNGPEAKVRGTAQQVLEKYQALARDAYSAGDRILAEGYLQHAEHYYRILNSENEGGGRDNNRGRQSHGNRDEDMNRDDDQDNEDHNSNSRSQDDKDSQDEDKFDRSDDEANGLQRTVSRGQNGRRQKPAPESEVANDQPAEASDTSEADETTEQPAAKPKPRARRPRKVEQPAGEATDQSAAD